MGMEMPPTLRYHPVQGCFVTSANICPRRSLWGSSAVYQDSCRWRVGRVSAQAYSLPERTLMLPLTEGSLRLRADDEDSLTSEDSFFSATEVNRLGDRVGLGQALWARARLCGKLDYFV